jgi:twitching motility protein PilT
VKEKFEHLLHIACQVKASDLHLTALSPPVCRVHGELRKMKGDPLTKHELEQLAESITTKEQWTMFQQKGELDFSYEIEGLSRFRMNLFRQRSNISLAVRVISTSIPSLDTLSLPPVLKQIVTKPQGLVLVTGPTGSGKSTTLASMIDYINKTMRKHIITLEDPIEYVHTHQNCVIQQREVGQDTLTFADGLRAALRQDPDIVLVGEMRDLETISTAITAAETGHLVFGTLHTSSAPATIERIIDVFPAEQQAKIRLQLASVLVAAIAQRLFPRADGKGRVAATEILINNSAVANLIRNEKIHQIPGIMQTSKALGMHTLASSIEQYISAGIISMDAAAPYLQERID